MSSPTPHKSDSGMRRSALSAAFEELALRPTTANDETVRPMPETRAVFDPHSRPKSTTWNGKKVLSQDWSKYPNISTNTAI
jgi:hypothetical protein|tara:strand:+ start:2226 stop:2468 length:243 start_codon:yes stop_codon:yes gene_type:complete